MDIQLKTPLLTLALLTTLGASAPSLAGVQQGDILVRAGVAYVSPQGDSDEITGIGAGAKVEADDATSLGITFTYMATDNIGIGVLAAWPFEHDIDAEGSIAALGTVAEIEHLPPTVTLQWHFTPSSNVRPYVGAGINYTTFFSEDTKGALASHDLSLDDSWGLALEAGVDIDINSDWFLSGQVWYLDIDTDASLRGPVFNTNFDVEIDPWVMMLGVGTKF
ncbi:MAG: outer membrane beta-barrel protein [Gammaproteobacteria bacterium]|nr:outer membrane beta-barrel protein [Gammaproteobacteria bacterium]MBU2478806.1 outer membrane beta-barrel protein [Gammaproteobacteria bacterium]